MMTGVIIALKTLMAGFISIGIGNQMKAREIDIVCRYFKRK
jgi:hypothetical protein